MTDDEYKDPLWLVWASFAGLAAVACIALRYALTA